MNSTRIHKILGDEIEAVHLDKDMNHVQRAICFNKLINVFNRTTSTNLRATKIASKLDGIPVPIIATKLKQPSLK